MSTSVAATLDGQGMLDAVAGAGCSVLGHSRQGRTIAGRTFPGPAASIAVPGGQRPPARRRLLFFGGIHGDEPASVQALLELVMRQSSGRASPGVVDAVVIPALNPDGLVMGRKNSFSDVDLNRNFPARNFTREHAPGYDPGPSALSEPETALLARLIDRDGVGAVVAVHAPFACINFDGPARAWADTVALACGWPVRENIGYPTPGSLGSWLGIDRSMPILTLELPPGPLAGFRGAAAAALDRAWASAIDVIGS